VAEDGRTYYAQSCEFDTDQASGWVKENVIAHLDRCDWHVADLPLSSIYLHRYTKCPRRYDGGCPWRKRSEIALEIAEFCDPDEYGTSEFWGWCSGYDSVAFCQLFGTMMDLPAGYPHYIRDIQQVLDERGITDAMLPEQEGQAHNALADARHIQKLWEFLQ
jgi:hypothetical protein